MKLDNPPRKPYLARGSTVRRCTYCRLPVQRCICEYRTEVDAEVDFLLLTHRNETYKPTNTGRLILQSFPSSRLVRWESRQEPGPALLELLADPKRLPVLVFPLSEDCEHRGISISKIKLDNRRPVFILLDGTWRQARRMFRLSDYLSELPIYSPENTGTSTYALRKREEDAQLCTAEIAIAVLERWGDTGSAASLGRYFQRFNQAYFSSRRHRGIGTE